MLNRITIDAFMRIAHLDLDLSGARVHGFWGGNEQGKSSLAEAVRFCLRGLSARVKLKGDYGLLIHGGRRSGSVELLFARSDDAAPDALRRNVRDGKLAGDLPWDLDDEHYDVQLGATEFGFLDPKVLRKMLLKLFGAKADLTFVAERLAERGVTDEKLRERILPLIRSAGFEAAAAKARDERLRSQGEWRGITQETYGSKKAEDWRPAVLSLPRPTAAQIAEAHAQVERLEQQRNDLRAALGAAKEVLKLRGQAGAVDLETARQARDLARERLRDLEALIETTTREHESGITDAEQALRAAERALSEAKQAAVALACPSCDVALKVQVLNNQPTLVRADTPIAAARNNVLTASAAVTRATQALQKLKEAREAALSQLRTERLTARQELTDANEQFDRAQSLSGLPLTTPEQVEDLAGQITQLDEPIYQAATAYAELVGADREHAAALQQEANAKRAHEAALQWALVEECCGPTAAGIPAELIGRVTKPVNTTLTAIYQLWEQQPVLLSADMTLQRADGMPYGLLSESARWRANVAVQLALAALTPFKLVVIDRFDVLEAPARGVFFDTLSLYSEQHPDVTILAFGTLKSAPPDFPGVEFHHISEGRLQETVTDGAG